MNFKDIKRTKVPKRKLMLWVDEEYLQKLEGMKPPTITLQESIRQIIKYYIDEGDLDGL